MRRDGWECNAALLIVTRRWLGRALATLGIAPTKNAMGNLAN